jgi:hypothetical protein
MTETKYGKYFLHELPPEQRQRGFGANENTVVWTDDDVIKGSPLYWAVRWGPNQIPPPHGPHAHKNAKVLALLGMDPDDPNDLGAEIDICMGEEMEKHTITRSTLVYIPAHFVHCPIAYRNVRRPFLFIQSQYAPKLTEISYKKLLSERERENMIFFELDGHQTDEDFKKQRESVFKDLTAKLQCG